MFKNYTTKKKKKRRGLGKELGESHGPQQATDPVAVSWEKLQCGKCIMGAHSRKNMNQKTGRGQERG